MIWDWFIRLFKLRVETIVDEEALTPCSCYNKDYCYWCMTSLEMTRGIDWLNPEVDLSCHLYLGYAIYLIDTQSESE